MNRYLRYLLWVIAVVQAFFGLAFTFQLPIALQLWPFPNTTPLTYIFIGSIFLAAAASTAWCLITREDGALAGVGLDYVFIFVPISIFSFQVGSSTGNDALIVFSVTAAIGVAFGLYLLIRSSRIPIRDTRPMPKLVKRSFIVFVVALVIAGGALVLKTPNILPWNVTPELSVVCGWIFLGAAAYFTYALLRPSWGNTGGQLAGFLAYDLVLILPFLQRLPTTPPEFQLSLYIYITVVVYSGLLAFYYLFINPATRLWGTRAEMVKRTV